MAVMSKELVPEKLPVGFNRNRGAGINIERSGDLSKKKESVGSGIANSLTAIRSLELSKQTQQQVHKQQHQPPSETQQILTEPKGQDQAMVGGGGASTKADWVIFIRERLDLDQQDGKRSIYKVPHHLREGDEKAYVPQIVSLGPYHLGKERLRQMEEQKWFALKLFLKRKKEDVQIYLDSIKELETKARDCYEGPIDMDSNEFVLMLVLDGCFVLELFRVALRGLEQLDCGRTEEFKLLDNGINDPVFTNLVTKNLNLIQRDMIMLENQIPLFILDRLLALQFGHADQKGLVAKHAVKFFQTLMPAEESPTKSDQNRLDSSPEGSTALDPLPNQGLHFLDVFRQSLLRTWPGPVERSSDHANPAADKRSLKPIHCVTELRDAGIKFEKRDAHQAWDIKFKNGVLEIPRLVIDDVTESLFLNLIAFEQCHLDCPNNISSYVLFMDHLINSSEDVCHLHHCGIIEHWLGSPDKVAEFFNRLCQQVVFNINDSCFSELSDELNSYYGQRWHAWTANLKHKYFSNPWVIISAIIGAAQLLLTLTQTVYEVYDYYRPSKV